MTDFATRHIGPRQPEVAEMLATVGVGSLDELIERAVPASVADIGPPDLASGRTEAGALAALSDMAGHNRVLRSLIGMGYHDTFTPAVIRRNVLSNPAWYTAYTPYQPEISQGRLEALLNFQTMVADLTAMDLANASLLDEATAAAEAMTMLRRVGTHPSDGFFVDADCHPQTIEVVRTRAEPLGIKVVVGDAGADLDGTECFGALLQYPASSGAVLDPGPVIERVHAHGGLVCVATDLLALTLLIPPGELGADAVVGTSQRFGVPLGFGGPHAAFLATRQAHRRSLPGRLVGVSVDSAGRQALRLALQTREQHIRREKATSNICTAQVLLAVMAGLYACWHGPEGLAAIAERVHGLTTRLAGDLKAAGIDVVNRTWFDTLTVAVPGRADDVLAAAVQRGINLRRVDADTVGVSLDETTTDAIVDQVIEAFGASTEDLPQLPSPLVGSRRASAYLTHPVFHQHRSETEMMRYVRRLSDRDLALDRAMIPLGSCTMKLNAAAEMEPVSWPELARIHPFAPADQTAGYRQLVSELSDMLLAVTGYDAVSLQPNSGAQGEYAGLLAIRGWHHSRGDSDRDVCLIPSSAHGTNPASAVMAGLRVMVVACDDDGTIDVADLAAAVAEHGDRLAALMITYPSTHGVFEETVTQVCDLVHEAGGQVYVDGANLNALVGVAPPGHWDADISHLNLHKTFCIPHGGGGPGVGPVACKSHLAPFLPNHPLAAEAGPATGPGPVAAAPWGSAGILAIPWMYVAMMGPDGLAEATRMAILNANYVAARLAGRFPVLYTGPEGLVAHECIVDLRPFRAHVSVDDVAKRLVDHGFHAPTMSFPVAGTLMIEPTESESRAELDRFCDAMLAIRDEIDRIAAGEWPPDDNPLANAPHTAEAVTADEWTHPYPRSLAALLPPGPGRDRYWPPVGRIDQGYGDRHLVCACPPVEAYAG